MDATAELGRKPVSKKQIQSEYGDERRLTRDGTADLSREITFLGANGDREEFIFSAQLADHKQDWQPYPVTM